jgi:hypothetical protein
MESNSNRRFRVNLSETAKGLVQVDCTAEVEDPDQAVKIAADMLQKARSEAKAQGRQIVGE